MDDNPSSDDEVHESPLSPKLSSKKLKLNDGSSQDSIKDADSSVKGEKEENVDSGISADKSESTSSDDRVAGSGEGPSSESTVAAPSSSNVRAIVLNISRPKRARNYRKRRTPGSDSDSDDSSGDSDDMSAEEMVLSIRQPISSNSDIESEDNDHRLITFSDMSRSGSYSSNSHDDSNSVESVDMMGLQSADTDSDEDALWSRSNDNEDDDDNRGKPPSVLLKNRPKHQYPICRHIINRELGLSYMFEREFYGSLHAVYRLDKLHQLHAHKGCVNSINFHPEGNLLASGSDDTNVVVWDWARNIALQSIKTGHKSNVFQSKFLHLNARSQLNIVTCARDGQVRLLQCPPGGGAAARRRLAAHARTAHKLHVSAAEPHVVVSAGEDGLVMQCDVREDHPTRLFVVKDLKRETTIPLYSVHGHPLDPRELIVAGRDKFVRMYDRRKSNKPLLMYCPTGFAQNDSLKKTARLSTMHLTCAIYNHNGSEILGSYNDEDVYLFDAKRDVFDKDDTSGEKPGFTHQYSGHRNSATFKGVSFFGPNSEYVVSGSDCSYIYIWDKKTEAIVQWMQGDINGVVNCVEAHPTCPILATSGLDKDIKIWIPKRDKDPNYEGMERVVRDNGASSLRPLFRDFLPTLQRAWPADPPFGGNIDFDSNACTTF